MKQIITNDIRKINNKYDLDDILKQSNGEEMKLLIERNGEIKEYLVKPKEIKNKYTGMYLDDRCKIVTVEKGSPAETQGVQANDKILKINNEDEMKAGIDAISDFAEFCGKQNFYQNWNIYLNVKGKRIYPYMQSGVSREETFNQVLEKYYEITNTNSTEI